MKKKKIIIYTLIFVVCIAAISGILIIIKNKNHSKKVAKVYSGNEVCYPAEYYVESSVEYGDVSIDNEQKVYITSDTKIKEILIEDGQKVSKGDVLFTIDTTKQGLQIEKKQAELAVAKSDVDVAERELTKLKNTVPLEDLPKPVISNPVVSNLSATQTDAPTEASTEAPTEAPIEDNLPENDIEQAPTRDKLARMIKAKEIEISKLKIKCDLVAVSLQVLEKQNSTGEVVALYDGYVKDLIDKDTALLENLPLLTVSSSKGCEIRCSVDEFTFKKLSVGDKFPMISYDDGCEYTGTITELNPAPEYIDETSAANSRYMVILTVDDIGEGSLASGVEIRFTNEEDTSDLLLIHLAFVKQEGGRYYVMKDVDGKLKKVFIETGKSYYGEMIEVKSGISMDEYYALPTSADAIEGVKTEHADINDIY